MAAQGFRVHRNNVSQRGIALLEVLVGILVTFLGAVLAHLNSEIKDLSKDYQADYRDLRKTIESTNSSIKDAITQTEKQQVEFKATIGAKLELLSVAVEKKKSR